ncbi:Ribonuclease P protein component 3 [Thermococcus gammatolerans]|uniref:Ribonuclease P protein component 3 n=1 Tax=Thermococcus gammatolerans (strain DSM 15229 / JCM 11827 / EJ3) TaxID=593117 RepID=RNP3_THEGJ|nr:Ribonuclease P protein component 3 [Thermococcus gammatolerans]C5A1N9.1 RecName: Full=Ribonuclease P protein component 3; Short=RNase P component 3; AltName: Full=Rpp30 [Thermococcus gammatolerans EJ3]ACS34308.1 Ribonuclease P protein component 3 (rnp3) [Thermococcus gammatolerans EJ3]
MSEREYFVEMDVRSVEAYELAKEWFDEVVFTKKLILDTEPDWDSLKEELRELRRTYGKVAVLLVTRKPSLIRTFKARNLKALLYVQGGDMRVNRMAIEAKVDALISPWLGRKDYGFDHTLAGMAGRRGVAIGFSLSPLLRANPYERALTLRFMAKVWELVRKYRVPRFITSSAESKWEVRGPRDLMSLGINIGMEIPEARASLNFHPRSLLSRL